MLNPLFNLPFYLIGIYFGLINFSIQKGISLFKKEKDSYAMIELLEKNETPIKNNDNDNNGSNNDNIQNKIISENEVNKISFDQSFENGQKINADHFELNDKLIEMPFLLLPIKFLNFHQGYNKKCLIKLIILFFVIFIIFSSSILQIILSYKEKYNKDENLYSLEGIISNQFLNIFYLIDIELIVFMINWILFVLYSKSEKNKEFLDFLNARYWLFFVKSYFSFTLVSIPINLYTFYQSEIIVKLEIGNIYLYYFINIIFILLIDILLYSCFEFPLKKIFKTFFIKEEIIELDNEQNFEENDDIYNDVINTNEET